MKNFLRNTTILFLVVLLISVIGTFVIGPKVKVLFHYVYNFLIIWFFSMIFLIKEEKFTINYLCIIAIIVILASGRGIPPM